MSSSSSAPPEVRLHAPFDTRATGALHGEATDRHAAWARCQQEEALPSDPAGCQDVLPALVDIVAPETITASGAGDAPSGSALGDRAVLCDASDAGVFVSEVARTWSAEAELSLNPLARGLTEWADEARATARHRFDFDIDMPALGLLQGRVSISNGQTDLELHACQPASAAALRARRSELQRLIDRESDCNVSLFIV
jgi:hypothetical protein